MTPEEQQRKRQAEEERKLMERRKMRLQLEKEAAASEKADWRKEAMRDLFDPEQKALFERRKQLAEDVGSGAAARRGAEAGLRAQMAAAGAGRGSAASRMRGLARAQEAGVRGAAAQGAGAAAQQFGMLGQAGEGRFGMMKSDKAGRLGFFQKSRGLDVAEKAAEQQAAATRAANQSTGKASGGEIFKEFKRKNGQIEGPGTETSDSIKAMLSDGEFVVNAKTVRGIGEAMGAKGKEDSRKKGAGFLYDLQTKYGDKKPVKKMLGGMQLAELGAHAAKSGLLGKKLKGAGSIAAGAIDAKKGIDAKKSDLHDKEADVVQKRHQRETEHHTEYAKGGHINLGKGVKAKRKYREAIGWESDKIFDKKAEKDYKEGDTGYKNYKGEKSVTPVKMGLGGFLGKVAKVGLGAAKGMAMAGGNPAGAVVGGAKGAMDVKSEDDQKSQAKKQAIAQAQSDAAAKKAEAGKAMAADEVQLKEGGAVKKDHPHYKYLKDLDKFMARQFPKGKKVETDPAIKAEKAMRAKKGSIEPMKFKEGALAEKMEYQLKFTGPLALARDEKGNVRPGAIVNGKFVSEEELINNPKYKSIGDRITKRQKKWDEDMGPDSTIKMKRKYGWAKPKGQDKFKLDPEVKSLVKKVVKKGKQTKDIKFNQKPEKPVKVEKPGKRLISRSDEEKVKGMKNFKPFGKDPEFGKPSMVSKQAREARTYFDPLTRKGLLAKKNIEEKKRLLRQREEKAKGPEFKPTPLDKLDWKQADKDPLTPADLAAQGKKVPVKPKGDSKPLDPLKMKLEQVFRKNKKLKEEGHSADKPGVRQALKEQALKKKVIPSKPVKKVSKEEKKIVPMDHRQMKAQGIDPKTGKPFKKYVSMDMLQRKQQDPNWLKKQQEAKDQAGKEHDKRQAKVRKEYKEKNKRSFWDKITGGDEAEAKRLGMDVETYKSAKKKAGKGTGLFGRTEEDIRKAASKVKPEVAPKVAPKTEAPKVKDKEVKDKDSMSDKDKAGIIFGAGKGLLDARKQYLEAKQKRRENIAKGEQEAAKIRAAAGQSLIAAPVSLRRGGRVSFKDVLKAKKKMGY